MVFDGFHNITVCEVSTKKLYIFQYILIDFWYKNSKKNERKSICFLIMFFIAILPRFLRQFDTILRPSWAMLGPLGTHLGGFGGHLGASWGILGLSWNILKPSEAILKLREVVFEQSWAVLEPFGGHLGAIWEPFGTYLGAIWEHWGSHMQAGWKPSSGIIRYELPGPGGMRGAIKWKIVPKWGQLGHSRWTKIFKRFGTVKK